MEKSHLPMSIALRLHARNTNPVQGSGEIKLLVEWEASLATIGLANALKEKLREADFILEEDIDEALNTSLEQQLFSVDESLRQGV